MEGSTSRASPAGLQGPTRGHYGKALQRIVGSGLAKMTPEVIDSLERCFTHNSSPIPRCPADAPPIFVESSKLQKLIREGADGSKGGPSGWTCELLLPLLGDVVCADGIAALDEDCCNGCHDPHSGHLIRSSLMAAANKKNPDKKAHAYDGRDLGKAGFKVFQGSGHT